MGNPHETPPLGDGTMGRLAEGVSRDTKGAGGVGWERGSPGRVGVSGKKKKKAREAQKETPRYLSTFWFACRGRQRKTERIDPDAAALPPGFHKRQQHTSLCKVRWDSSGGSHKNRADGTLRIRACCARKLNRGGSIDRTRQAQVAWCRRVWVVSDGADAPRRAMARSRGDGEMVGGVGGLE